MSEEKENRYKVIQLKFTTEYQKYIEQIYGMLKDQYKKIYDLTCVPDENPNQVILDELEFRIKEGAGFAAIDLITNEVAGFVELEDAKFYEDVMVDVTVHPIFRKKYWGKETRKVAISLIEKLKDCYNLNRLTCFAPQIAYGCIKLLKDVGFKHEGTIKNSSLYKDKTGKLKYYDTLVYGYLNE